MLRLTEILVRLLQGVTPRQSRASHLERGERGETAAYFYLRRRGYRIVATNFRTPGSRGEIDLIGWDNNTLCFIEVKTRADDSFAPPSAAVTQKKQKHIREVAKAYLRRLPGDEPPSCRFDVVSVVPSPEGGAPELSLQKGAFRWATPKRRAPQYHDYVERRFTKRPR